jgi:hypothetical protein
MMPLLERYEKLPALRGTVNQSRALQTFAFAFR